MKNLLIIIFLSTTLNCLCQSYWQGYEKGFYYGCQCNNRIPNSDYLYKQGTYSSGYNEGVMDGKIFRANNGQNTQPQGKYDNNTYFQRENIDLLYEQMYQKQKLLNDRRSAIRLFAEGFYKLALEIKEANKNLPSSFYDLVKEFNRRENLYINYNLLDIKLYGDIMNDLQALKNTLIDYL